MQRRRFIREFKLEVGGLLVWQGFCDWFVSHPDQTSRCFKAEQFMTDQHYFETAEIDRNRDDHPGRKRSILAKRQAQNEARKQREIEIKRRSATQLRTMIAALEREVANLDDG